MLSTDGNVVDKIILLIELLLIEDRCQQKELLSIFPYMHNSTAYVTSIKTIDLLIYNNLRESKALLDLLFNSGYMLLLSRYIETYLNLLTCYPLSTDSLPSANYPSRSYPPSPLIPCLFQPIPDSPSHLAD